MLGKMKELMKMKQKAEQIKRELDSSHVEVNEVLGIRIVINGSQDFQSIEVDETLLRPENKKQFEKDLLCSINGAVKKSQTMAARKMKSIMPGGFPDIH